MNALEIANLLFYLIQTGNLHPDAEVLLHKDFEETPRIASNKLVIFIRS